MLTKERLEGLEKTLRELAADPRAVIVEGKRDRNALSELGIMNVVTLERLGLRIAETLTKDAIVLTDFDLKGRQVAARLRELLNGEGLEAEMGYRREIKRYSGISSIEELPQRIEQMREEIKKK